MYEKILGVDENKPLEHAKVDPTKAIMILDKNILGMIIANTIKFTNLTKEFVIRCLDSYAARLVSRVWKEKIANTVLKRQFYSILKFLNGGKDITKGMKIEIDWAARRKLDIAKAKKIPTFWPSLENIHQVTH